MLDSPKRDISLSEMLDVLGHQHRRRLLVVLSEANPRERDEVASKTVADDGDDLDLFKQELYHVHLPKLDATGVIDWDRETDIITRGPRFEEILPLLELMGEHEDALPDDWP
ncbi:hypothetical protein BG842_19430 [Haladaptatus sp. W1]|uniref:DUF7344 domain-containing protein n=1 Tax=Haladaptatus sp. W1 TaxID=1897478 RepID=UPI000849781A|nr:hypothetical protein [Haladaptatus sp. W1]ODR81678.1 hypothetical protein BG842_19430 [Haladaptatus sp. W1]